jgi:hypothetical protein
MIRYVASAKRCPTSTTENRDRYDSNTLGHLSDHTDEECS